MPYSINTECWLGWGEGSDHVFNHFGIEDLVHFPNT